MINDYSIFAFYFYFFICRVSNRWRPPKNHSDLQFEESGVQTGHLVQGGVGISGLPKLRSLEPRSVTWSLEERLRWKHRWPFLMRLPLHPRTISQPSRT